MKVFLYFFFFLSVLQDPLNSFEIQERCCRSIDRETISYEGKFYNGPIIDTHVHVSKKQVSKIKLKNIIDNENILPYASIILTTPGITYDHRRDKLAKKFYKKSKRVFGLCPTYMTLFNKSEKFYQKKAYQKKLKEIEKNLQNEWCVGIGEIALRHQIKKDHHPHIETDFNNQYFQDLLKILNKYNSVLDLHNEPILNGQSHEQKSFDEIEMIVKNFPNIKLVLSHTAMTNPKNLQKLLDLSPNVYTNFKIIDWRRWSRFKLEPLNKSRALFKDWLIFLEKNSNKVMFGSDEKFRKNTEQYKKLFERHYRPVFGLMTKNTAENIGYKNAIKVYNLKLDLPR